MDIVVQILTVSLGVLTIIWHQQKTINKLRDDTNSVINKLRDDTSRAINKLRDDTNNVINKLRDDVTANGERLARIEGFLRIDISEPAATAQAAETQTTNSS